jgi:hypothetical protein
MINIVLLKSVAAFGRDVNRCRKRHILYGCPKDPVAKG